MPYVLVSLESHQPRLVPLPIAVFGEVGLSGEIRPVPNGQERLKEAMKHGFKHAIIPKANAPAKDAPQFKGINVIAVERLDDAIASAFEL